MQLSELKDWMQELRPHLGALAAALGAVAGAGVFFALPFDPWWGWGLVAVGAGILGFGLANSREFQALTVAVIVAGAAFGLAGWQVARVVPVDFERAQKVHWLVGRVVEISVKEDNDKRATLRLDEVETYGLGDAAVGRASIGVFKSQLEGVEVGSDVALPVVLMAPEGPKFEGQRDGRLWRYFEDDRVTGYVLGTVEPTFRIKPGKGGIAGASAWLEGVRARIYEETRGMADGAVAALLIGEEKGISAELREAYRKTGLSHLLAISGMQMTLVALGIFAILRWLGALVPWVALRVNVRSWAAIAALAGTFFYTFLAGASVSLVRASVMAAVVMLAVLTGRMRHALRGWCAAVVLVILVSPVMVTRAGFQLSAVAVLGLVLLAMAERGRWKGHLLASWSRELILATVVAGAATAPVLVADFGQFTVLGMVANLVAVPVMTLATYWGMAALVLWPFGLEKWALELMTLMVEQVNALAIWLSGMRFASVTIDKSLWWVVAGFALVVIGSVLVRRWVEAAVAVVCMTAVVLVVAVTAPQPDVLVWDDGKVGLVREEGGKTADKGAEYRLLWAEDGKEAARLAEMAGVAIVGEGGNSKMLDERFMPVTEHEHFAWAERVRGHWVVQPVACGRAWQRMAAACWE